MVTALLGFLLAADGSASPDIAVDERCQIVLQIAAAFAEPVPKEGRPVPVVAVVDAKGGMVRGFVEKVESCSSKTHFVVTGEPNQEPSRTAILITVDMADPSHPFFATWCGVNGKFGFGNVSEAPGVKGHIVRLNGHWVANLEAWHARGVYRWTTDGGAPVQK